SRIIFTKARTSIIGKAFRFGKAWRAVRDTFGTIGCCYCKPLILKSVLEMKFSIFKPILLCVFLSVAVFAQEDPVKWTLNSDAAGKELKAAEEFSVRLNATIESGWHLYALDQPDGGPIKTTIKVSPDIPFELVRDVSAPDPK